MTTSTYDPVSLDVLLTDGTISSIRPVRPSDESALHDLNGRVSLRTRRLRCFSSSERPGDWYVDRVLQEAALGCALVAEVGGQIVALASCSRIERDPQIADLGVLVDDEHQHLGRAGRDDGGVRRARSRRRQRGAQGRAVPELM